MFTWPRSCGSVPANDDRSFIDGEQPNIGGWTTTRCVGGLAAWLPRFYTKELVDAGPDGAPGLWPGDSAMCATVARIDQRLVLARSVCNPKREFTMKRFAFLIAVAFFVGCSVSTEPETRKEDPHGAGHRGDDGSGATGAMLMVQTVPKALKPGESSTLKLMIHDADGSMVREFDVIHDKLAHLIMVRDGLDEFAHIHPEVDRQGNMTATHAFPKAGKYRLFVDYKPKGKSPATATTVVEVTGDAVAAPPLVVSAPGRVTSDGLIAEIEVRNPKAGQEAELRFRLNDSSGKPVADLQSYLGARGHLVILSADGAKYVHAHPGESRTDAHEVVFAAHFPSAGLYKGWGQFLLAGQVRKVPFVIQIP